MIKLWQFGVNPDDKSKVTSVLGYRSVGSIGLMNSVMVLMTLCASWFLRSAGSSGKSASDKAGIYAQLMFGAFAFTTVVFIWVVQLTIKVYAVLSPSLCTNIVLMSKDYKHSPLKLVQNSKVVFTSFSKHSFYLRSDISRFALLQDCTPISPFMNFDYNLAGLVDKDLMRIANNSLIKVCDELWVFGEVSDGVLVEIYLAQKANKKVRYFHKSRSPREFKEVEVDDVTLEDVSPWMWDWILAGKNLSRWHPRLRFYKSYPIVYPAYSKRNFYWQMHISQFCLDNHMIPLNPFMLFRYFWGDSVPREKVYTANNSIVRISGEVWSFGEVSDGVLAEIKIKKDAGDKTRYYKIANTNPVSFRKVSPSGVEFETEDQDLEQFRKIL